jgi:hypothetical protein
MITPREFIRAIAEKDVRGEPRDLLAELEARDEEWRALVKDERSLRIASIEELKELHSEENSSCTTGVRGPRSGGCWCWPGRGWPEFFALTMSRANGSTRVMLFRPDDACARTASSNREEKSRYEDDIVAVISSVILPVILLNLAR